MGSIHVTQPVGKPDVKDLTRSQRPNQKPKPSLPSLVEEAKVGEKVEERQKEEEEETSFEELMVKKNKMTKNMMTNMKRKTRVRINQNPKLIQVLEDLLSRFMSRLPCA